MPDVGLVRHVKTEMREHNLTLVAAGVAFYALLAIFPALVAVVTGYALVATPARIESQLSPVLSALPTSAATLVADKLDSLAGAGGGGLTTGLVVSLLATLWAASGGVSALMTGLTVIYGQRDRRTFVRRKALALAFTAGGLVAAVVALALVAAFPAVLDRLGLDPVVALVAQVARWAVLVFLVVIGLSVLYRWGPDQRRGRYRPVTGGVLAAVAVWVLASVGFSLYVSHFGSYDKTYGSFAGLVVLLMWLYLSAFAILLGAQVDAVRAARAGKPVAAARVAGRPARAATALTGASDTFVDALPTKEAAPAVAEAAPAVASSPGPKNDEKTPKGTPDRTSAARTAGAPAGGPTTGPGSAKPAQPAGTAPRTGGRHRHRRAGTENKSARPAA